MKIQRNNYKNYNFYLNEFYNFIFSKNKNKEILISKINEIKLPLDLIEIEILNDISKNEKKNNIFKLFKKIKEYDKIKYKKYKFIDYFFFKKIKEDYLNENKITLNNLILEIEYYINNYLKIFENIENQRKEKLKIAKKIFEENKKNNITLALEGGISIYINDNENIVLRENKDIDFIHFEENNDNIIQYDYKYKNKEITIDIFKNSFFLFQKPIPQKKDYYFNKDLKINIFKKKFLINRIENTILPIKRTIFLDYINLNQNKENKLLKNFEKIYEKYNFNIYPLSIYSENLIDFYLNINNGVSMKEKIKYLKKLKYATIYLLIYSNLQNHFLSEYLFNYFINLKINRYKEKNFLFTSLLIIIPYFKNYNLNEINSKEKLDIIFKKYLENKILIINSLN